MAGGNMDINIPGQDQLVEALQAEGAPPHFDLDIGGSADIDGDGLVRVSLGEYSQLVFTDI
ncbi:MAG: hypothetical protein RR853_08775 [Aurantimicrobium sp.]|uniref:hypothetical protein n=1 Tax=Aurantimicrobium sp. TaxID=1930784 RepID=UPI002FCAF1DA